MKAKLLIRINLILGSAIFSLLGLSGCFYSKYGCPEPPDEPYTDTIIRLMYGVPQSMEVPADETPN